MGSNSIDRLSRRLPNRRPGIELELSEPSAGCSTTQPLSVLAYRVFPNVCNCSRQLKKSQTVCFCLPVCLPACLPACLLARLTD